MRLLLGLAIAAALAACRREPPRREPPAEDLRRLAAALDVVATDYARLGGEPGGQARLRGMLHDADVYARSVPGAEDVRDVAALVESRADAARVAALARGLRRRILDAHGPIAVPVSPPSRERAEKLWGMLCAGCHGSGGNGDGPQGLFLNPEPRSFRDPEIMRDLSPLRAYSAITDGISGTAMPAWGTFAATDRWGLAFFVFGLRHRPPSVERGALAYARGGGSPAPSPTRLAAATDGELLSLLDARGLAPPDAADALAWLRTTAAFALPPSRLARARAELGAALERNRLEPSEAVAALERARDAFLELAREAPQELRERCADALTDARDLAAGGVLDEVLERDLRRASTCLDETEEHLSGHK